ncbi:MAG: DUF1566 domain-containing protein [Acidobacteriota bacterium]|nr:DUF1566 domain-containing protein [Acidobacteriota bacterium]
MTVLLLAVVSLGAGLAAAQDADVPVWKDDATGLTWTAKDNGAAVSPNQGNGYCGDLVAGGLSGWRLPTIDELEGVYDSKQKTKLYKAKGDIELGNACVLSGSANNSGDIWTFCFNSGSRNIGGGGGCSTTAHALCVHDPE